jgi:mono/diheme cytochrome c family protein
MTGTIAMLKRAMMLLVPLCVGAVSTGAAPTFNKDIAPMLYEHCASCHHPGEVAPFALLTYKDAKKHAADIVTATQTRYMPPWKAEPGHGEFIGDRRLSDAQLSLIKSWVEAGAPEGEAKDLPAQPRFTEGWKLGQPDLVVKMPEAFTIPAEGRDVFRCFVIPLNLAEDKYVRAIEFRPSNRKVVHHALFFLDSTGTGRKLDEADPGPGYSRMGGIGFTPTGGLGGWSPGAFPPPLPDGYGRTLRKGSDLVIQTHFHPTGKIEQEQSSVGIYFTKTPPPKLVRSFPIGSRRIDIPPGTSDYKVTASITTPLAVEITGIIPHAHLICKDMKVWATFPDGHRQDLIWIKDWDFNWQDQYMYKEPIHLPVGTKVDMEFTYDNSTANERNPSNPPKRVTFGEQTTNEMAFTFLQIVPEGLPNIDLSRLRDALRAR